MEVEVAPGRQRGGHVAAQQLPLALQVQLASGVDGADGRGRSEVGAVEVGGHALVDVLAVGQPRAGHVPGHPFRYHAARERQFFGRRPFGVERGKHASGGAEGLFQMLGGGVDRNGKHLVAGGLVAAGVAVAVVGERHGGACERRPQPVLQDHAELGGKQLAHHRLDGVHKLTVGARRAVVDDDGAHRGGACGHGRLRLGPPAVVVGKTGVFALGDGHRQDADALADCGHVDVAADDERLPVGRRAHDVEHHQ